MTRLANFTKKKDEEEIPEEIIEDENGSKESWNPDSELPSEEEQSDALEAMDVDELITLCKGYGIDVKKLRSRNEIIRKIKQQRAEIVVEKGADDISTSDDLTPGEAFESEVTDIVKKGIDEALDVWFEKIINSKYRKKTLLQISLSDFENEIEELKPILLEAATGHSTELDDPIEEVSEDLNAPSTEENEEGENEVIVDEGNELIEPEEEETIDNKQQEQKQTKESKMGRPKKEAEEIIEEPEELEELGEEPSTTVPEKKNTGAGRKKKDAPTAIPQKGKAGKVSSEAKKPENKAASKKPEKATGKKGAAAAAPEKVKAKRSLSFTLPGTKTQASQEEYCQFLIKKGTPKEKILKMITEQRIKVLGDDPTFAAKRAMAVYSANIKKSK